MDSDDILNFDHCAVCGIPGDLTCCDGCPQAFHARCVSSTFRQKLDEAKWYCPQCYPIMHGEISSIGRYQRVDIANLRCVSASDVLTHGCCHQLDLILQYLDWFITPEQVRRLASMFQQCPSFQVLRHSWHADDPAIKPSANVGILFSSLLRNIRKIVTPELFDEASRAIACKRIDIAIGLSRCVHYGSQCCPKCKYRKSSRYYCCWCGQNFSVKDELSLWTQAALQRSQTWLSRREKRNDATQAAFYTSMQRTADLIEQHMACERGTLDQLKPPAVTKKTDENSTKSEYLQDSVLLHEINVNRDRQAATALAGMDRMYFTILDPKVYEDYCGDHLFLMRSLFVASNGVFHDVSKRYFEDLIIKWVTTKSKIVGSEPDHLLDDMEALHVIHQLRNPDSMLYQRMYGDACDRLSISNRSEGEAVISLQQQFFSHDGGRILQSGIDGFCFGRMRLHNVLAWNQIQRKRSLQSCDLSDFMLPASYEICGFGDDNSRIKKRRVDSGLDPSSSCAKNHRNTDSAIGDDFIISSSSNNSNKSSYLGRSEILRIGSHDLEINWEDMCRRVSSALNFKTLNDIIGNKMPSKCLPMTPKNYCTHCGFDYFKGKAVPTTCSSCGHVMQQKVDYSSLCDALVFAYIFEDIGIDFTCGSERLTLMDIVKLLPLARCYQRIDELGKDTYKWQCYFITHVIYVFSDWGQHPLSRQLFAEEFEFLVGNMDLAIRLNDPELVGEFLQCLKILGMEEWQDQDVWYVMTVGYEYLMKLEYSLQGMGRWITSRNAKDQYHTSYCASIGLLEHYNFDLLCKQELPLPIPRLLKLLNSSR